MRKILVFLIIIPAVYLSGCREKSSDGVSGKYTDSSGMPIADISDTASYDDEYQENIESYQRVPEDYIPFDSLKVKELDSAQISQIYGPPIYRKTFVLSEEKHFYDRDGEMLTERLKNYPNAVINTFIWRVDSVRKLRMYYWKRKKGVYTPVWGYQYNYYLIVCE